MIDVEYEYSKVKLNDLIKYENKILNIVSCFEKGNCLGSDSIGWYDYPLMDHKKLIEQIKFDATKIAENSDVFVVCGIGGSYLGARAVIEALKGFKQDVEIMYLGNTFDEKYIKKCLDYLKDKDFSINVISKSGGTLETMICFRLLKDLLYSKYGENAKNRIYATTDPDDGVLRKMAEKENYKSYPIPKNIGGRYSVFTPVGLLPLAVAGVDIEKFLLGAQLAYKDFQTKSINDNIPFQYAAYRYHQYLNNSKIEIFASYSPHLDMSAEWWKQLFGESEGKDGKGLFPTSVNFSADLHSLGQYIQQGVKMFFITQLKIIGHGSITVKEQKDDCDNLNYLSELTLNEINLKAQEGTNSAHYQIGGVDNFTFIMKDINEQSIGYLFYTFMLSCMISANLIEVNPFNQPGVEFYKSEMKKLLKKD